MIPQLIIFGLFGVLGAAAWSFVLNESIKTGIIYGLVFGVLIGISSYLSGRDGIKKGKLTHKQIKEGYPILAGKLLGLTIVTAGITWIIRSIF